MDTFLDKAKEVALREFLPQLRLKELLIDKKYHITAMRNISTQFGASVVCDLLDPEEEEDKEFSVFLPKRYAGLYTDEEMAALPKGKYFLAVRQEIPLANGKCTYEIDIDVIVKEKTRQKKKN